MIPILFVAYFIKLRRYEEGGDREKKATTVKEKKKDIKIKRRKESK